MKMGFSSAVITPPIPCSMAGYGVARVAQGVHDDLYARALAFQEAGKPAIVLLALDVLNLDEVCMRALAAKLEPLGVSRDQLLVCCIHTHASFGGIFDMERGINPAMTDLLGEARPDLIEFLVDQSVSATARALSDMAETSVAMNKGVMGGKLATNRHAPEIISDQELFVLEFLRADGKKVLLYNLCCHPTVLNAQNRMLSADFAGAVAVRLQNECDMSIFVNGSAGDMSTRFTRHESSFAECERFADIVFSEIQQLRGKSDFIPLTKLSLCYHTTLLKEASVDAVDAAEKKYYDAVHHLAEVKAKTDDRATVRKAESFVEGASVNLMKARYLKQGIQKEAAVPVGLLTINGRRIVCSPFELFSSLALLLKQSADVEMFGYVNALFGYLADTSAFDEGDYEALMGAFARGAGEDYIAQLTAWLS